MSSRQLLLVHHAVLLAYQHDQERPDPDVAKVIVVMEAVLQLHHPDPVQDALDAGKIGPANLAWAREFYKRDPVAFRGYVQRVSPCSHCPMAGRIKKLEQRFGWRP